MFYSTSQGRHPGGWGRGVVEVAGGRGGRDILLYLIMREICSKAMPLKRNRITCPEVAANGQILSGKSKFIKLAKKIEIFGNLP